MHLSTPGPLAKQIPNAPGHSRPTCHTNPQCSWPLQAHLPSRSPMRLATPSLVPPVARPSLQGHCPSRRPLLAQISRGTGHSKASLPKGIANGIGHRSKANSQSPRDIPMEVPTLPKGIPHGSSTAPPSVLELVMPRPLPKQTSQGIDDPGAAARTNFRWNWPLQDSTSEEESQ